MFEVPLSARDCRESAGLNRTYLLQAKALQAVESSTLAALALSSRFVAARRAPYLLEGSGRRSLFLMVSGQAAVYSNGKVVELPGSGELFGEERVFGAENLTTVALLGHATALAVPASAVLSALNDSSALAQALLQNLSHRSLRIVERIASQAKQHALERVAAFIMQRLPAADAPCDVSLMAPKTVIASLLSMSKESFSRCLGLLSAEARIARRGRVIHVPAPARLALVCSNRGGCADCGSCGRGRGHMAASLAAQRAGSRPLPCRV